jgi:pSer/pThr/pTyr-binding forkhead associated (FHA) protein
MLFDHDSTNGVWMEESKVSGVRLSHGMSFRIVNFFFTFVDERQDDRPSRVFSAESQPPVKPGRPMDSATILFSPESVPPDLPLVVEANAAAEPTPTAPG